MKKEITKSFLYILLLILFACSSKVMQENAGETITVTDDLGRRVIFKKSPHRVMALTSSLTEMLYSICPDSEIIGRTQNCDYPLRVEKKPVINNYPVDFEKLLLLNPDIVFVKEGIISLETAAKIETMGIPVYYQKYDKVEDVFTRLLDLGRILDHQARAEAVVDSLRKLEKEITKKIPEEERPKVLMLISSDLFSYGKDCFVSDILYLAGGRNAIDTIFNNAFPQINKEYILQINPDIIIAGESVGIERDFFNVYPELRLTKAFQNKRTYTLKEADISRPGPRIIESIKAVSTIIHDKK